MSFKSMQLNRLIALDSFCDDDVDELYEMSRNERIVKDGYMRLNWAEHRTKCLRNNSFTSKYHMQAFTFDALVGCLKERITLNYKKARASTGFDNPIYPELIVGCGLRFLGGELQKSCEDIFGFSKESTRRVINLFLDAVDECDYPRMDVRLPSTETELRTTASDWMRLSSAGYL